MGRKQNTHSSLCYIPSRIVWVLMKYCYHLFCSRVFDQPNPVRLPILPPVRAGECGLARQVWQSRPAPTFSFFTLRLNLALPRETPTASRDGVHLFMYTANHHRSVPNLSDNAIAYRWRSLPRARSPQCSCSNGYCLIRQHHVLRSRWAARRIISPSCPP